jgi:spermidine synthase
MQPWTTIERATTADGTGLELARRGEEWAIRAGGRLLMSSRQHGSEEALAAAGCERPSKQPTVLVGGLGMGFTLRAVLDRLGPDARVVVSELVPAIVGWNRTHLAALAARPLEDGRVEVVEGDVFRLLSEATARFDAILLDVDNGPEALTSPRNVRLYSGNGLEVSRRALKPGGALVVWSAAEDPRFERRLERAGFAVEVRRVEVRRGGRATHVLFVATSVISAGAARSPGRGGSRS